MMVIFESEEADLRHSEFDIKPLYTRYSKDNLKKFICIYQALEGNIQKFVQANSEWIKVTKWISQLWKNHLGYESFWDC